MGQIGRYAFIAGLVIAFLAALLTHVSWFYWVLAVLGLVVGFLNVTGEETRGFLLAAIGLILSATSIQVIPFVGEVATYIAGNLVAFIAPAVLVVALKVLFETAKD
jgi:hypothetical protein